MSVTRREATVVDLFLGRAIGGRSGRAENSLDVYTDVLPDPPVWTADWCAAGTDGTRGCSLCVDACPYGAISIADRPSGTMVEIDNSACMRCGACTGVCPTSSLERSFLPDDDLRARLVEVVSAVPGTVLVLTCDRSANLVSALGVRTVELPSLLILNETHLLQARLAGAAGVAIVACPSCHHGATGVLAAAVETARALTGDADWLLLVVDDSAVDAGSSLRTFVSQRSGLGVIPASPSAVSAGSRRSVLAELLAGFDSPRVVADLRAATAVPGFATVEVDVSGCTLCGACARTCPTAALTYSATEGRLDLRALECVACGLCVTACPEQVLTLHPGVPAHELLMASTTLVQDTVIACEGCGEPYLPARLLAKVRSTIGAAVPVDNVGRCPACRSVVPVDPPARQQDGLTGREPVGVPQMDRRGFLAAAATLSIGGTLGALAADGRANAATLDRSTPKRLGMVIDLARCIGCHACTAACKAENHVPLGVYRDWVEETVIGTYPDARPYFVPKLCNHCDDPGCLRVCPTGAIFRRRDGIIDINHDLCIGCRACNQACPYGATFTDPVRHTADKCNLCAHRIDEGLRPACVDVCPSQCRIFGDFDDSESAVSVALRGQSHQVLRPDLGLGPNVRYLGLPTEPTVFSSEFSEVEGSF